MQGWMREARQGTYLLESRQQHLTVSRHRSCAMLNSGKTLPNISISSRTTLCKPGLTILNSSMSNKSLSYSQTMAPMLELVRRQPNLAFQHLQMPQPTLKTVITTIILPSLANNPDTRLKGTEKLMDHLEEELLTQTKTQPDTPMQ